MNRIKKYIGITNRYLYYVLKAGHRKGYGIHSPFIFEMVSNVLFDRSNYEDYAFFSRIRDHLGKSGSRIEVKEMGAPSYRFNKPERSVKELVRHSSVKHKYGKLLYRLVKYYKPSTIIEFGTSVGLSTVYLGKGNEQAQVSSVEGNSSLCDFARHILRENGILNVSVLNRRFDDALDGLLKDLVDPVLVFIDGDHRYEPTMHYYNCFAAAIGEGIIVLDDIHWSEEMNKAWKRIIRDRNDQATLDLFSLGIVILKKQITPRHYIVRF
ncbi:MAG: class I SAM-dependent methyltransferase [Bacteroidales bacterium]|jgi:predicted O-methyltransferase YrrM